MTKCYSMMVFLNLNLGHLNLIQATKICLLLVRMGHPLFKRNDIPVLIEKAILMSALPVSLSGINSSVHR